MQLNVSHSFQFHFSSLFVTKIILIAKKSQEKIWKTMILMVKDKTKWRSWWIVTWTRCWRTKWKILRNPKKKSRKQNEEHDLFISAAIHHHQITFFRAARIVVAWPVRAYPRWISFVVKAWWEKWPLLALFHICSLDFWIYSFMSQRFLICKYIPFKLTPHFLIVKTRPFITTQTGP